MEKKLLVVGLGYVGLPLALLAKEKGWNTFGYDIDEEKVKNINNGISPFDDSQITENLKKYPIEASTNPEIASNVDVIIISVPTPVTDEKQPDLSPLKNALTSILPHLKDGQLISIESTINPGVMDEMIMPILDERKDIKLDVVHCPERINPGDKKWTVRNIPRVIGGYTKEGTQRGREFYESILDADIKIMNSVHEAEAVKILENTFRDINIAFVNEMAKSFDKLGVDIKNVIEGAATKPFAFMPHYPGSGVGGHCISVDPYYMIERARQVGFNHEFLKLARQINNSMPAYTVDLLEDGLKELKIKNPQVALLGLSYKKNVDDVRESPAFAILCTLQEKNIDVKVFDPHVPEKSSAKDLQEALKETDAIILACDHDEFTNALTPEFLKENNIKLVIDGKNALDADGIAEKNIAYHGIGRSR